jgi:hypothetical protein
VVQLPGVARLASSPRRTPLDRVLADAARAERFRGTPDLPSYLRQPYGPGWALVGDAGLLMDPVTGQGISLAGSVPLRQFMSPRTMVRLVGVGRFARLAFGQARPQRPGLHVPAQPGRLEKLPGSAAAE